MGKVYVACVLALALPAAAGQETCVQCQHADCLKVLIAQKEKMAAGYDDLARKFEKWLLVEGKGADAVDFRTIKDPAEWNASYCSLDDQLTGFNRQANEMAAKVGPPLGCTITSPVEQVGTNTVNTCETDQGPLKAAQAGAQCREIGELLDKHESVHRKACEARRNHGMWNFETSRDCLLTPRALPYVLQTPAGRAREEAAAYRVEIEDLKKLHERAKRKCNEVETSAPSRVRRTADRDKLRHAVERVTDYSKSIPFELR